MANSDSFAIVQFAHNPTVTTKDIVDIEFENSTSTIKTADLTYEGTATKSSDLCGVLGFVDEQGRVRLSSNFELFVMRPKLTDFVIAPGTEPKDDADGSGKLNRTDLDEKFGTEKKRRSVHSKKRNTIETSVLETAVSAAREQVLNTTNSQLDESTISNPNLSLLDGDEQATVPTPNREAKTPAEVFVFDDIVSEHDLLLLHELCSPIVDASKEDIKTWAKEGRYPPFVCDQMKKLPVDHGERIQSASRILYLHYLIQFFKRSMFKRLSGKPFPDDAPRSLQEKALRLYAVANVNERTRKQENTVPPRLRLKLTAHICVLTLYICRFMVDLDSLRISLGSSVSLSKLQDIFSELGCRLLKVAQTSVASLEVPLPPLKSDSMGGSGMRSNRKRKRTT